MSSPLFVRFICYVTLSEVKELLFYLTRLEFLAGLHRVANPEPFELGLIGLKGIIMALSL